MPSIFVFDVLAHRCIKRIKRVVNSYFYVAKVTKINLFIDNRLLLRFLVKKGVHRMY